MNKHELTIHKSIFTKLPLTKINKCCKILLFAYFMIPKAVTNGKKFKLIVSITTLPKQLFDGWLTLTNKHG